MTGKFRKQMFSNEVIFNMENIEGRKALLKP